MTIVISISHGVPLRKVDLRPVLPPYSPSKYLLVTSEILSSLFVVSTKNHPELPVAATAVDAHTANAVAAIPAIIFAILIASLRTKELKN